MNQLAAEKYAEELCIRCVSSLRNENSSRPISSANPQPSELKIYRSSGRNKFDSNTTGGIRNITGSWDIFDKDNDSSKLSRESAEREVEAPLDVRTQGSFQVSALDVNIDIHLSLGLLFSLPSCIGGRHSSGN